MRFSLAALTRWSERQPFGKASYSSCGKLPPALHNYHADLPEGALGRSHSPSFDQRCRPEMLRTAMASAFFCPTKMTSRLPRVIPVKSRYGSPETMDPTVNCFKTGDKATGIACNGNLRRPRYGGR
jgi:hypothetical protein